MASDLPLTIDERGPSRSTDDEPIVVLVHGSLDRAASFARVVRRLVDLPTVTYDRRGYDRSLSAGPGQSTLDGHVNDLVSVIDDRPAVVIGHSLGGVIALAAALRIEGAAPLISVAAFEPPLPWLSEPSSRPPRAAGQRETKPPSTDGADAPGKVAERFFRRMVGDSAWDRLPESTRLARRADGPALVADLASVRITEEPFDVTQLTIPVVLGRGTNSLPHHRDAVEWLIEHAIGSELIEIDGAGHGAHLTHPDAFAGFVRAAVQRATQKAGSSA
jgi:pimeloyl-ACP methyl ester carboxylesterase